MKKINYTKKDTSPHLLMLLSEMSILSAIGDLEDRNRYTKKWRELLEKLRPIVAETHSLVSYLDYCYEKSAMPSEELMATKTYLMIILEMIENISDINVQRTLPKIVEAIKKAKENKKKKNEVF